jgi:hypothetical protein
MDLKKKIIIVEDNDVYRAALKGLINAQDHLEGVAKANSGVEAIENIERCPAGFGRTFTIGSTFSPSLCLHYGN